MGLPRAPSRLDLEPGGGTGERGELPHAPEVAADGGSVVGPGDPRLVGRAAGSAAVTGAAVPGGRREAQATEVTRDLRLWRRAGLALHANAPAAVTPRGPTRTKPRTNEKPALASDCERGSFVVPGARFELARVAPYAPQTYVSTNSTTRALHCRWLPAARRRASMHPLRPDSAFGIYGPPGGLPPGVGFGAVVPAGAGAVLDGAVAGAGPPTEGVVAGDPAG